MLFLQKECPFRYLNMLTMHMAGNEHSQSPYILVLLHLQTTHLLVFLPFCPFLVHSWTRAPVHLVFLFVIIIFLFLFLLSTVIFYLHLSHSFLVLIFKHVS